MKVRIVKYTYQTLAYNKTKYHIQYKFLFWWKTLFIPDGDKYSLATATEEEKDSLIEIAQSVLIGNRAKYTIIVEPQIEVTVRNFAV